MKRIAVLVVVIALAGLVLWRLAFPRLASSTDSKLGSNGDAEGAASGPGAAHAASGSTAAESRFSPAGWMRRAFSTPITFYGQVVDQHGTPVEGATITAAASISMGGESTETKTSSDVSGHFSIRSRGASLFVSVDKPGYYHIYPKHNPPYVSEKGFDYVEGFGGEMHSPDPTNPVIFHLYKPGIVESLIRLSSTSRRLNKNGEAVEVALDAEHGNRHKISLACKMETDTTPDGRYTWRFEVRPISGGLIERTGLFQFEAPADGYRESDVVEMPATLPRPQWFHSVDRSYFVHFDDDTFARIEVMMAAGGDYFASIEGYYNPKRGSRNLETDPARKGYR